ncbi:MAG: hypothetical protein AAGJ94_00345 [Pseudomonadota bacterium]
MSSPIDQHLAEPGLPWPDAYGDLLEVLRKEWQINGNVYLSRQLGGGKSGALVYAVDVTCADFAGHAILKLDNASNAAAEERHEAKLHQMAFSDAPKFAEAHLPKLLRSFHDDNHLAILSTIVNGGLEYAEPWSAAPFQPRLQVLQRLSRELLEDWNADYTLTDGMVGPAKLLQRWLDYRLNPDDGGRIHSLLADDEGLDPLVPSIVFEGKWYPNPLAFALGAREIPEHLHLRAITGRAHGDLHGLNILTGRVQTASPTYYLIDLAFYDNDQPLFYDHAYLELATLLTARGDVAPETWDAILSQLRRSADPDEERAGMRTDDLGLVELVRAVRGGITGWVEGHEQNRLPAMENQYLLARVAAGLNFSHKKMSATARKMAFTYAAANLKDFLKLNRIKWPKHGVPFFMGEGGADTGRQPAEVVPRNERPQRSPTPAEVTSNDNLDEAEPRRAVGGFFYELRRRNVVKVAGVYVIASWLSMQVVAIMAAALRLPDWTDTLVALLLGVGFLVTCAVTWAFEVGPDGLRRAKRQTTTGADPPGSSFVDFAALAGIAVILVFGVGREVVDAVDQQFTPKTQDRMISLAVLPFQGVGADDEDTFADGLTIELTNTLQRTGLFRMPGMTSMLVYKGNPVNLQELGQRLSVDYVVEGSVRRSGGSVRIEARLVETREDVTVWTDAFQETMNDLFQAQENVAEAIGRALATPLNIDSEALAANRTTDPQAYSNFVSALPLISARGEPILKARTLLEESVDRAPEFAAAWAALSLVYDLIPLYFDVVDERTVIPSVWYRRAQDAVMRAEKLAPDLAIVHQAAANTARRQRQWSAAQDGYEAALAIEPNNDLLLHDYTVLMRIVGKHSKAIELNARAIALNPYSDLYRFTSAALAYYQDPSDTSLIPVRELFDESAAFRTRTLRLIIGHYYAAGRPEEARQIIDNCTECDEDLRTRALTMLDMVTAFQIDDVISAFHDDILFGYQFIASVGGLDAVLKVFTMTSVMQYPRSPFFSVPWILVADLNNNAEFKEDLDAIGLVDYWRERGWPDFCIPDDEGDFTCGKLNSGPVSAR